MKIIVGETAGFCYGVKRAVNEAKKIIENNVDKTIYCLGEIVHNKQVVENLQNLGINFIEELEEIKEKNSKLIIRAHGISKNIYEQIKKNNIDLQDFTCPNVLKIHKLVERYQKDGFYIILTGTPNHPEVQGIISCCGKNFSIVEQYSDVENALEKFNKSGINKLLLISQTTYSLEKFNYINSIIKEMVSGEKKYVIENTICLATEVRQKETEKLSKKVDLMIIIGGKNSSNTKKLYEIAKKNCKNTINIETNKELKDIKFDNIQVIGIMAGASTPQSSIDKVKEYCNDVFCKTRRISTV